ncbi:hypothetical protein RAA17_05585 [Komagataeibacter rhaeticus]|nr:hypothetical protein [Komagataeibacter rhaeticus]
MLFQSGGDTLLRIGGDYTAEAGGGVLAGATPPSRRHRSPITAP